MRLHIRWATVRSFLQTHIAISAYLPTTDGKMIHLRHCSIPTPKQAEIYGALGIAGMPFKSVKIEM